MMFGCDFGTFGSYGWGVMILNLAITVSFSQIISLGYCLHPGLLLSSEDASLTLDFFELKLKSVQDGRDCGGGID